jgi:hypothetical protein
MSDELDEAAEKDSRDDYHAKAHRQARAYRLTQIVPTATMQQHQLIEGQMAAFLKASPQLVQRLAHWRSDDSP